MARADVARADVGSGDARHGRGAVEDGGLAVSAALCAMSGLPSVALTSRYARAMRPATTLALGLLLLAILVAGIISLVRL